MLWASIISIFFLAGIIVLGFLLTKPTSKIFLKGRRGNWVFGSYLALLFIGAGISYLIPSDSFEIEPLTDEEMKVQQKNNEQYYDLAWQGRIDEAKGAVFQKEWELPYEGEELNVPFESGEYFITIFVEETEADDGIIRAGHYTGKAFVDNIDITSLAPSPELKIEGDTLQIIPPEPVEVKVAKTAYPYPFHQFTDGYKMFENDGSAFFGGEIIYLRVPSDVKVTGNVEYVGS
jgi:hypothetical protein